MNHFLNVLDGFVSILDLPSQSGRVYVRRRDGFAVDQKHLRSDVEKIGDDIKKVLRVYGEQGSSRSSYQQER
jgi:hypothetical protein